MPSGTTDPLERICDVARSFSEVEEGLSCSQISFKTNGKAFLFAGMQGGRCKLMFKLNASLVDAERLADKSPDDFQVGSTGWVTARFTREKPIAAKNWRSWLKESYQLSAQPKARAKQRS